MKDLGNIICQIDCSFEKKIVYEKRSEIMFDWCLTFDAVYIYYSNFDKHQDLIFLSRVSL